MANMADDRKQVHRISTDMRQSVEKILDKSYKTMQAHNYEKREETFVSHTTVEEARENARQLIKNEEIQKSKAEKKEAKKKRQRERKQAETGTDTIEKRPTLTFMSNQSSNGNANAKSSKPKFPEQSEDGAHFTRDEQADDEFLDMNAAFVKVAVKHHKNIPINKTPVLRSDKVSPLAEEVTTPMPKFVKPKTSKMSFNSAEKLAQQCFVLAIKYNDFHRAVSGFTEAIFMSPQDVRHFLNRSYCYLRLGQYSLALGDAQIAKKNAESVQDVAKALAREGQAFSGLHRYHEAEKCFEDILKLEQGHEWIIRELIIVRVLQLTDMGFSKYHASIALQQCTTVDEAVTLLTSGNITSPKLETSLNMVENCNGDEEYFSDDESSSVILLSKLVTSLTEQSNYFKVFPSQPRYSKAQLCLENSDESLRDSASIESLTYENSISSNGDTKRGLSNNLKIVVGSTKTHLPRIESENNTIWVGNVNQNITDQTLQKFFSKFGSITGIRRLPSKYCVFINFHGKKAVTKALYYAERCEINGMKLLVKPADRTHGKK
ncbi:uncharacterized protein LOC105688512 [Athalia rosae]|uniref:uncharacterized protein LOC105688512 n=1 Tax=Athalia rosae TaxID=37344 RepID=UPI002033E715|nr:uncharacterized protein LOC105688512 [Athalia rosae]